MIHIFFCLHSKLEVSLRHQHTWHSQITQKQMAFYYIPVLLPQRAAEHNTNSSRTTNIYRNAGITNCQYEIFCSILWSSSVEVAETWNMAPGGCGFHQADFCFAVRKVVVCLFVCLFVLVCTVPFHNKQGILVPDRTMSCCYMTATHKYIRIQTYHRI